MGDINLAKNMVLPAARRRKIYQWMLVYLLACLILLPVVAHRATANIREGLQLTADAQIIRQRFLAQHPEQTSMLVYANKLRDTLQQDARHAAAVGAGIPSSAHSVLPLFDLLLRQGGGDVINRLAFEQQDRNKRPSLEFSLIAPADRSRADIPAPLKGWQSDEMLMRQFTAITPTTADLGTSGGRQVQILRYRAVFKE